MKKHRISPCMLLLIAAFIVGCGEGTAFDITKSSLLFEWDETTPFTTARAQHTSVAYNGYLYVIGGIYKVTPFTFKNDVQYAKINSDGTVGAWTATNSFTTPRSGHTSVAYNGYLYVIGGYDGSTYNDVPYAQINADALCAVYFHNPLYNTTCLPYNCCSQWLSLCYWWRKRCIEI